MAEKNSGDGKPAAPPAAAAPPSAPPKLTPEQEREELLKTIIRLERENKTLQGQISGASPQALADLKAKNQEIKTALLQLQKDVAQEFINRKIPLDVTGISDKLQVFKAEVLAYCNERKLDPSLWKKLESL